MQLRQFELALETLSKFANAHPEVLAAALTNAYKFVPNISVGGTEGGIIGSMHGHSRAIALDRDRTRSSDLVNPIGPPQGSSDLFGCAGRARA